MDEVFGSLMESKTMAETVRGVGTCLTDANKIKQRISSAITTKGGALYKIPIIGYIAKKVVSGDPLNFLEKELRTSIDDSLHAFGQLGEQANIEKERITDLEQVLNTAEEKKWGISNFLGFIEENTNLNFEVRLSSGDTIDMKEYFSEVYSNSKEEKEKCELEYFSWMKNQIEVKKLYLRSMNHLGRIGGDLIQGMARSYASLSDILPSIQVIDRTIQAFEKGGSYSITVDEAIMKLGESYVQAMSKMAEGYNRINEIKYQGKDAFEKELNNLEKYLESYNSSTKTSRGNGEYGFS